MFNGRWDEESLPTYDDGDAGERTFEPRSHRVATRHQPLILSNMI